MEYSNTDARLCEWVKANGYYCPIQHKAQLMQSMGSRPEFFLKSETDVDGFVMAHQRRAGTWVRWEILEEYKSRYYSKEMDTEIAMREKLAEEKQKVRDLPALCATLKDSAKLFDKKCYTTLDRLLATMGATGKMDESWLAEKLREREQLWSSRGITADKKFDSQAYTWYRQNVSFETIEQQPKLPLSVISNKTNRCYEGQVVALGTLDDKDNTHLVLKSSGELLALPLSTKRLKQYSLGQAVSITTRQQHTIKIKTSQELEQSITRGRG